MKEHIKIVNDLLYDIECRNVLDLGSGKTSMGILLDRFPLSSIDGICYPGDNRKLDSIRANCEGNYKLIEMDICKEQPNGEYDLVMCHLLLGETLKFGNKLEDMLNGIFKINTKQICIVDYLEDIDIDYDMLKEYAASHGFVIEKEMVIEKSEEEVYEKFIGKNYIGYMFKKN